MNCNHLDYVDEKPSINSFRECISDIPGLLAVDGRGDCFAVNSDSLACQSPK